MRAIAETHYRATSKSADAAIKLDKGFFGGFIVTASVSGVIRFYDNTAASGTVIVDQMAVYVGDTFRVRMEFQTGLFFDLVSGSATVTILYI